MGRAALAFHNTCFSVPVGALLQMTPLTVVSPRQRNRHCPRLSAGIAAKFGLPKLRQLTVTSTGTKLYQIQVHDEGSGDDAWQRVVASVSKISYRQH